MLLIVQIAVGVCAGLLLFRFLVFGPRPSFTVRGALAVCASLYAVLYVVHLILTAAAH